VVIFSNNFLEICFHKLIKISCIELSYIVHHLSVIKHFCLSCSFGGGGVFMLSKLSGPNYTDYPYQHSPGGTEENHIKSQQGQPTSRLRFERSTSYVQVRSFIARPVDLCYRCSTKFQGIENFPDIIKWQILEAGNVELKHQRIPSPIQYHKLTIQQVR
jgi:hypothetical protein